MKIKEIQIKNFRNYSHLNLKLNENFNVFFGRNGSGKTNILEAVSMLISGKSFRNGKDKDVLNFNAITYEIDALIERQGLEKDYNLVYQKDKKKKIQVNLSNVTTLRELRRESPLVVFMPEDMKIVKEGPSLRRKYLDEAISNLDLIYRYNLSKYNKILREKNELLKVRNKNLNERLLFEAYNIQLASLGSYIVMGRKKYIDTLNEEIKDIHLNISDGDEIIYIDYSSPLAQYDGLKEIENQMLEGLRKALDRDLYVKYSTYGPHRDDLEIFVNDKDLKVFGSQGQQRSAILSMKIVEIHLIKKRRNINPILLLDDVFSELDSNRRKKLIENISGIQSFITMAEKMYLEEFNIANSNIYLVENNGVKKLNGGNNDRK
ncbi:MAG: DNA replication/repair protein RecF [Tissierellia bacterium]|jgi:DNA replication and repair protein RecF|nr:DNA replication/repair protein RecF [Tissierellia bacterium]